MTNAAAAVDPGPPRTVEELEDRLSAPTPAVLDTLRRIPGDIIVLGAGGKMGPSLARMLARAAHASGDARRIIAVSRWRDAHAREALSAHGIETLGADLLDRSAVAALPDAPNVIYMAGQKFGTMDDPSRTWAMNAVAPAIAAERFRGSRIVAFSTGNVYPLSPVASSGSRESDPLTPIGEYANSCVARERVFEYESRTFGTPVAIVRLNYAVDLRYGVLVDIARRVWTGEPVDVTMGHVNVIWQGDANAAAIECLAHATSPATPMNVTGHDRLAVRAVAMSFGRLFGRTPDLHGVEASDALLSDTTEFRKRLAQPTVSTDTLISWVATWVSSGNPLLGKPTHFETRDGSY